MANDVTAINQSPVITGSGAADTVKLTGQTSQVLMEVLNVDGAAPIYFRKDGTAAASGAAENHCVPATKGASLRIRPSLAQGGVLTVSVFTTAQYQVSFVSVHENVRNN